MIEVPESLKDASTLLSNSGFVTSNIWFHGTSSALLDSIKTSGLKRSGDKAMNQAAKQTMATIGNSYTEMREPVFLTQSSELAYYWAEQAVQRRAARFGGNEAPVVLKVELPEELNKSVKPDVGAAGLLMIKEGEGYMIFLARIYEYCKAGCLDIDLMKADRMEYLQKLGMAYFDRDIVPDYISVLV